MNPTLPPDNAQQIVRAFNDALNARDLDGMMRCLSEDTVFENTTPPPDGTRATAPARPPTRR